MRSRWIAAWGLGMWCDGRATERDEEEARFDFGIASSPRRIVTDRNRSASGERASHRSHSHARGPEPPGCLELPVNLPTGYGVGDACQRAEAKLPRGDFAGVSICGGERVIYSLRFFRCIPLATDRD